VLTDLSDAPYQTLFKSMNRMAVVRRLCANPGLFRSELATELQLAKSTVGVLVDELIDEGWLVERDQPGSAVSRRRRPLFVDDTRLVIVGAEVRLNGVYVVATSLTGDVLARSQIGQARDSSAASRIGALAAALLAACEQLDAGRQRVIGIGIGVPGAVDEASGPLDVAAIPAWRDVPFAALLGRKLERSALDGVPLFVQNEAHVAVLGEMEFNPAEGANPLLYLSVNHGVGVGVIVDERLLTGRRGFAGEVGHTVLQLGGPVCTCGRRGCAEALICPPALLADAGPDPVVELRRRLALNDPATVQAVRTAGSYLGVLMHNLACAYDPACIVLGGSMTELGDAFLRPALQALKDCAVAGNPVQASVRRSRFGPDAVPMGAAALARYRWTRPQFVAAAASPGAPQPVGRAAAPRPENAFFLL
jgi:predicted NBD/HSP70 family sugar kinase